MKKIVFIFWITLLLYRCDTDLLNNSNINPRSVNQIDLNFIYSTSILSIASNEAANANGATDGATNIGMCAVAIQHLATSNFKTGGFVPDDYRLK